MVLDHWFYAAEEPRDVVVLPDGCRDLVVRHCGRSVLCIATAFDSSAQNIRLRRGEALMGFRLRPGATFNDVEILDFVARETRDIDNMDAVDALAGPCNAIRSAVEAAADANDEFIQAVRETRTVGALSMRLGVTVRTLNRHVRTRTGHTASFWLDLARARRALRALKLELSLAEVADIAGYADQAHMTRAFSLRFGSTPARSRANSRLMSLASLPGFSG